jgi:hypothetical protein
MSSFTCEDYKCEGTTGHDHIGVQPHLRRVMRDGILIDGKTGETPVQEVEDAEIPSDR